MRYDTGFPGRLRRALAGPLPAMDAWIDMVPPYRRDDDTILHQGAPGEREASVLICLHPGDGGLAFPVLRRAETLRHHAGQIALPGGALDPGETPEQAALRETEEELGLRLPRQALLGRLSDISALPSRYRVHPFVAWAPEPLPPYRIRPDESGEAFDIALDDLMRPSCATLFSRHWEGRDWTVPCFRFETRAGVRIVWGLTAMILAEFRAVLAGCLSPANNLR